MLHPVILNLEKLMRITITYYLDVVSSWCFWAEPAWEMLKQRYRDAASFDWKIALMDKTGLPTSKEQHEWYYRRSGTLMRSPFMLNSGWANFEVSEYLAPNCVAEAGKDFGVTDDTIRLALASAALRDGQKVGDWELAAEIAAKAVSGLEARSLLEHARSAEVEKRVRSDTTQFHRLKVTQRPTFVLDTEIGDRAVFSGFANPGPITAAVEAMLADAADYTSFAAHFGNPPP
jgi:predicted DsbA family dithiol-disulfide isomerase